MMEKRFLTFLMMSTGEIREKINSHPNELRRWASEVFLYIYIYIYIYIYFFFFLISNSEGGCFFFDLHIGKNRARE